MATSRLPSIDRSPSSSSPLSRLAAGVPAPAPRRPLRHPELARPRVRFCWVCSGALEGWMHRKCIAHGNEVIAHVRCARMDRLELAPGETDRFSPALCYDARKDSRRADEIIQAASRGDRLSVAAVAAVFGPMLEGNVFSILCDLPHHETDLVVDDFFGSLLAGENRFGPAPGRGVDWMRGIVRAMARVHLAVVKGGV